MKATAKPRSDTSPQDSDLLTPAQVCEYLGISQDTYYRWRREGYGPPITRLSVRKVYVRRDDLEKWVKGQREKRKAHNNSVSEPSPAAC